MRLLSILYFSPPSKVFGGTERQMHSLHKGLLEQNIDVQVLASIFHVGSSYQVYEGVPIWGIKFPSLTHNVFHPMNALLWLECNRILRFVEENIPKIDLIQVTPFREPAFWGYWLSKRLKVPWLARLAGSRPNGDFNYMENSLSRNVFIRRLLPSLIQTCSAVIAVDEETFKEAIDTGFGRDKVVVISNSVVLNQIPPVELAKEIPKDGILLFLGRISPEKRVTDLVEAYSICKKKRGDIPGLTIVGGGEIESLRNITKELVVEEKVNILGQQWNVEQFLSRAVCMVNPSESEGFPNSVLEACAFGVPSILSDIPVHRKIARHIEMEQFLFPVGNVRLLAEKIMQFLSLNVEEVREKRTQCAIFAHKYSKSTRDRAYVALYEKLIRESQMSKSNSNE